MENLDGELLERVFFFFPKNKNGKERLETLLDTLKKLLHTSRWQCLGLAGFNAFFLSDLFPLLGV